MEGSSIVVKMPPQTFTTSIRPNSNQAAPSVISAPLSKADNAEASFLISYHREQETGDLIETLVSSNKNRVTARSVNSPQDVTLRVSQDQRHEPGLVTPTRYEYNHAPFRATDPYSPSNQKEGHHFLSGTVFRHQTGMGTMSDQGLSVAEVCPDNPRPFEVTYQDQGHYRGEGESSRCQRSPPVSPGVWGRADNSAYIVREGGRPPTVKLSSNSLTARAKSPLGKSWTRRTGRNDVYPSRELLQDGQFVLEGPDSRHDRSSVFIAVPVNSVKDKRRDEEMDEDKRRRDRGTRGTYLMPRSRSWSYPRRVHLADAFPYSNADRNSHHDYEEPHGDALYISDDGHLYANTRGNKVLRDDNYVLLPPSDLGTGREKRYSLDDLDFLSASDEDDYFTRKHRAKGHRRSRSSQRWHPALSEGDFQQTIPVYTHRALRSDLSIVRPRHERYRERRRRRTRHDRASPSSYSDHDVVRDDDDYNDSEKRHSKGTPRQQLRQQRPSIFSENRENVSSINVTSFNEKESNPYPLGVIPPNTFSTNFALFPSVAFPPSVPNPYTGLPYSPTPGNMDQLVRNSNLTYTNMRSYLDAMSASLANIPASTIGVSPYVSQQLLQQHSSDPMDNVDALKFFRSSNPINSDTRPLEAPDALIDRWSEGQWPNNKPSFSRDTHDTTVNGGVQEQHGKDGGVQEQRCKDGDATIVAELMPPAVRASANNPRSVSHNVKDVNDRELENTGGKTGQTNTARDADNRPSTKERKIQFSEESKSGLQKKILNNSAVQTESDRHKSPPGTPPQSPPPGPERAPPLPQARGFNLKRSTSRDNHTQTIKSSPPATMPKPKGATSPEPRSPLPQASASGLTYHRINTSSSQDEQDQDDLLRELDSSFFAISNLAVMDLPGSTDNDVIHNRKKNFVQSRVEKLSEFADNSGQKYNTTQIISPSSTHPPISGHPDADYDVYPRKSLSSTAPTNARAESPGMANGDHVTLVSTRKAYTESSGPFPLDRARSFQQAINSMPSFAPEPVISLSAQKSLPDDFRSLVGSATGQQRMTASTNPQQSLQYPTTGLMSVPQLLKTSQPPFQPYPHFPRTPEEPKTSPCHIPRVTYRSLSGKSPDQKFSGSPLSQTQRSQKMEDDDTDSRRMPYQFYKGDPSILAPTTSKSTRLPLIRRQSWSREEATPNSSLVFNSGMGCGIEPSEEGFIFYKGPNLLSIVPKEAISYVVEQAQPSPLLLEVNIAPGSPRGVSAAKLKSNNHPENATSFHQSPISEVPIPPRDFDSDADNSEYIYTSTGWSHLAGSPNILTAMFCTGVEDNSARHMCQLYTQEDPYENIMHTFFRDCLPYDATFTSLTNMDNVKKTSAFKRPVSRKLSTSTLSMKWNLDFDKNACAPKTHFFDAIHQHMRLGHESPDLDSGVSLNSQNSRDSFRDFDLNESDDVLVPGEDYSSNGSNISSCSMELGWDYLSCNESVKEMDKRRQL